MGDNVYKDDEQVRKNIEEFKSGNIKSELDFGDNKNNNIVKNDSKISSNYKDKNDKTIEISADDIDNKSIYCTNCGSKIKIGDKFCTSCGKKKYEQSSNKSNLNNEVSSESISKIIILYFLSFILNIFPVFFVGEELYSDFFRTIFLGGDIFDLSLKYPAVLILTILSIIIIIYAIVKLFGKKHIVLKIVGYLFLVLYLSRIIISLLAIVLVMTCTSMAGIY